MKNFTQIDTSNEHSEITWEHANFRNFQNGMPKFDLTRIVELSNGVSMQVYFNDPTFEKQLHEKFIVSSPDRNNKILGELYWESNNESMAKGWIDGNEKKTFIQGKGFGIFKSVISGVASHYMSTTKNVVLPIHGAALANDSIGRILIVGGHGAGKTTGILNLTNQLQGVARIASDDWLITNDIGRGLTVTPTDSSISISKKFLDENPHLQFPNIPNIAELVSERKMSFDPATLLGADFSGGTIEGIQKIIVIRNDTKKLVTRVSQPQGIGKIITSTAYHYPYNSTLATSHNEIWDNELSQGDMEYYIFNRNHAKSIQHGYNSLLNVLIKN